MGGNPTPAQIAAKIQSLINQASGKLTDILEGLATPAKQIPGLLETIRNDLSIFLNDSISPDYDPNSKPRAPKGLTWRQRRDQLRRQDFSNADINKIINREYPSK